jgi:collagenase-like PrtC family protease
MLELELLAPARNIDIGIAAIDCGADAVYIAGPDFGARQAAGNSVEDIAKLCSYAHRFGARVFITINTIIYDQELDRAKQLVENMEDAGADAFIVQDLGILQFNPRIPLHASTQCAIRTPEKARFYESLGFSRLVLERELSLEQIAAIRKAVSCELEFFIHGALCVCYSGECYMSEFITGRSANRGACIQACRSLYDLQDEDGKILVRNKALLSLKDYNLKSRLEELAENGICSFKIEGRLKNISYVRNVVRDYSIAIDRLIELHPDRYRRSSFGKVVKGFMPDTEKTFNRGYTELFIDGKRGQWSSMDAAKSMGELIGTVDTIKHINGNSEILLSIKLAKSGIRLANGDGFAFIAKDAIVGFRGDVCEVNTIRCKAVQGLYIGVKLFRNISAAFEKELDANKCVRLLSANITLSFENGTVEASASSEDGRLVKKSYTLSTEIAENQERMMSMLHSQLSKISSLFDFGVREISAKGPLPIMPASFINGIRRDLAEELEKIPCNVRAMGVGHYDESVQTAKTLSYKYNVANHLASEVYSSRCAEEIDRAYELEHQKDAELMRTKYCIRYELGLCPKYHKSGSNKPLFLLNNGQKFKLYFDCKVCEMTVSATSESHLSPLKKQDNGTI